VRTVSRMNAASMCQSNSICAETYNVILNSEVSHFSHIMPMNFILIANSVWIK